ncbi:MAG: lysozyme [Zoogloeaceae bacterium]|nr:lysozyme [Zoogloeaceae bacterium]
MPSTPKTLLLPDRFLPWPICWTGVVLIAESESCRLTAYRDITGVWTLGWGQTAGILEGMRWSQIEADADLCNTLIGLASEVHASLTAPASDTEFAAMVSLAYNIGVTAFRRSSILKCHNQNDKAGAARAFALWNKAGGRIVQGLVNRRAREATLYLASAPPKEAKRGFTAEDNAGQSPDADPVKPLAQSPTVQTGAASVATGALALASQYSPQVSQVARSLSISPVVVVAIVAIVAGAVVIWRRYQQRKGGVA